MEPLELGPKEGLALINGTQFSTAIALDALFAGERVFGAALAAGALSVDALKGSVKPFDPRISSCAASRGRSASRAEIAPARRLSEIVSSHGRCGGCRTPTASAASRR
jgi:histidine ammonia-lyase